MRYNGIDILKLYTQKNETIWNEFLSTCVRNKDINSLAKTLRELQVGMTDLEKKKLDSPKIHILFARLIHSIEKTAKQIIRIKHPMPLDNPLLAKNENLKNTLETKRKRDRELSQFLKESSF